MLFYDSLHDFQVGQKKRLDELDLYNIPERGVILRVLAPAKNQNKLTNISGYSVTHETDRIYVDYLGIVGDRHRRETRNSTGREKALYPKGTEIRNQRHLFAVSPYDCKVLSDSLGLEVTPELLGANLVIGRADGQDYSLSHIPQNTYLLIAENGSSECPRPPIATLVHYVRQQGCGITGNAIASHHGGLLKRIGIAKDFIEHSKENRGIVCSIEQPVEGTATLEPNQVVFFKFPKGIAP